MKLSLTQETSANLGKGLRAVADQAFFVGAVFVVHVMFARNAGPEAYGIFAVAYAWFILLSAVQHGALVEPMMVFGSGYYKASLFAYSGQVSRLQWIGILPLAALLCGLVMLAYPMTEGGLGPALISMLAAAPVILWHHLHRKALYVGGFLDRAALSSAVYLAAICVGGFGVGRFLEWTAPAAFAILGFASALAGYVARSAAIAGSGAVPANEVLARHLRYGKWSVFTWILTWIPANLYMVYLSYISLGVATAGVLKAIMNLNAPGVQLIIASSAIVLPYLSRLHSTSDFERFNRTVRSLVSLSLILGGVYLLVVAAVGRTLVEFFYGPDYLIGWLGIALAAAYPLTAGVSSVLTNALRAAENAQTVFWSSLVAALTTILIGIPLVHLWGVTGALAGGLTAQVAGVAYLWLRKDGRHLRRPAASGDQSPGAYAGSPTTTGKLSGGKRVPARRRINLH